MPRLPRNLLAHVRNAARYRPAPLQLWDLLVHKLRINIGPVDYYDLRFYTGQLDWDERARCIGYNGSRFWPFEGNALKYERLFARKGMQKALLQGLGVPTPRLIALAGRDCPISTREALRELLAGIDRPFVLKPDGSLGGQDIMVLTPGDGRFLRGDAAVSFDEIWDFYRRHFPRGLIVEERVRSHPDLEAIYPHSLNTLRVISIRTRDGRWHLPHSYLRTGRGGSQVDNSTFGGLMTLVRDGRTVGRAWECHLDEWFERHPDTGVRFADRPIPMYEEALAMIRRACSNFGFMRTIGWDLAITAEGPMIIEANAFWNPQKIQLLTGPVITQEIAAGLQPRSWYTPWDRTHMYPNYREHYAGGPLRRWHARRRARFAAGA